MADVDDDQAGEVIAIVTGAVPVGEQLVTRLPALRLVLTCSVGTDHLDLATLERRGIAVANTPTYCAEEARPALRTQEFFETYFGMAERGELDEDGKPSLLRSALLGPEFADETRLVSPPWPLQRAAYALLAPIARMRGYSLG